MLEQVTQECGRDPISADIQGQIWWGPKQPDLFKVMPDCCRVLDTMAFKGSFQPDAFYAV